MDDGIYDSGLPREELRARGPEPLGGFFTWTRHNNGVGAVLAEERDPLEQVKGRPRVRAPRHSGVRKEDVPMVTALKEMSEAAATLGAPGSVKETAGMIIMSYYEAFNRLPQGERRGATLKPRLLAAVALLKAAQIHGVPIGAGDVSSYFGFTQDQLLKASFTLNRLLPDPLVQRRAGHAQRVRAFIDRVSAELGLPERVADLAWRIFRESFLERGRSLAGRRPEALAAAAVYIAARLLGYDVSQKTVGSVVSLKEVMVRKSVAALLDGFVIVVEV